MNLQFEYQGIWIEADLSPFVKATRMDPPEGGDIESMEWTVDNIDVLLSYLDLPPYEDDHILRFYLERGHLPNSIRNLIESRWDLETVVYETALEEKF